MTGVKQNKVKKKVKSGAGRPISIPSPWGELAKAFGSSDLLAEHFCVAYSTIQKWAQGVHRVPEMALKEVRLLCKQHRVKCKL